ncbi:PE-PGRS family protein [Mycobacterium tuberculosis]|nr:PE-PGRS family protein [Mycobacterium tuberculosis]
MSFVLIAPEFVTAAAGDLTNLGSSISAANASAASATTQVLAAGADEVSARIAALFGGLAWSTRRLVRRWRPTTSGLCRP